MSSRALILLGSNLGDRLSNIQLAADLIGRRVGTVVASASLYETAAQGIDDAPAFINTAVAVDTELAPSELLQTLLQIERDMGRIRTTQVTSRPIDLDIGFYGNEVVNTSELIIPHTRLHLRRFALAPLVEIAPDFVHPSDGRSLKELLESCPDQSEVTILSRP